ncbi:MAG: TonB family protein [Gammaproteobacteria bacterium]|nr:TonB family protein [Gammaproteobacteria bacterium]
MSKRKRIKPTITDHDRFGMALLLTAIFHGMVILGVTFSVSSPADSKTSPALDIILVQTRSPEDVEKADYLAQVSQQGGGMAEEKARPKELFSAPTLSNKPAIATHTGNPQLQKQKQNEQLAYVTQKDAEYAVNSDKNPVKAENDTSKNKTDNSQNAQTARLAAEISSTIEEQASINRTRYLNSSTREFTPAKYMREWINRVERIGNLNYPDQARRKNLSGTLILDVVINANGELVKTDLRQSSGHQILDDAAKRIVKLAAPFSAFPEKLRAEADVIHITRSWEFFDNSNIRTR